MSNARLELLADLFMALAVVCLVVECLRGLWWVLSRLLG